MSNYNKNSSRLKEGSLVYVNKKGHSTHGKLVKIVSILAAQAGKESGNFSVNIETFDDPPQTWVLVSDELVNVL